MMVDSDKSRSITFKEFLEWQRTPGCSGDFFWMYPAVMYFLKEGGKSGKELVIYGFSDFAVVLQVLQYFVELALNENNYDSFDSFVFLCFPA